MADGLAKPLLALVDDVLRALTDVDSETGEVPAEAAEQLDALALPLADKATVYSLANDRLRADEDACRKMAAALTDRARARAAARERLNARMHEALALLGGPIKAPTVTAYLHPQKSVELTGDVPDEFCTVKVERKPDLRSIKAALERGEQLPFATLVLDHHVRYR